MKQVISRGASFLKRLTTRDSEQMPVAARTSPIDSSTPEGWEEALPYRSIPGPKQLWFLGNSWRFLPIVGNLHGLHQYDINTMFYKKYGNIARLGGLSFPDTIMIYSPKDIEHLFRNEGTYPERSAVDRTIGYYRKTVRPELFQDAPGVSEAQGKEWFNIRSKLNPIVMNPQAVMQYVGDMDIIANKLIMKMRNYANSDPRREMPDDFSDQLYAVTLEMILFVCLDKQLGCLENNLPEDSEPAKLIRSIQEMFGLFYQIETEPSVRNIYKTKSWTRFVELMDFITFTLLKHIEASIDEINKDKQNSAKETSMLGQLLKSGKNVAVTTAIDLLTGGVDTTGKVMGSGLYYLARNPKAQTALRNELYQLLPNKDTPLTKEVISNASYLKAVVKEVTRLAPIGLGNLRRTVKDMVLSGYKIPKGTNILTSNFLLCLSDEQYVKAKEFIPERWLRTTTGELSHKATNPFVSLPFGYGPRVCLGKRLSLLELETAYAKIIRNFYLEWPHQDMSFGWKPFYGVDKPLKIRVTEVEK